MLGRAGDGLLKELLVILGLFGVQCIYGVYMVFLDRVLSLGVDSLFLVALASFAAAIILIPFAVAFERKKWPAKMSPLLVAQLVVLALGGVAIFQLLMMLGIERTSPEVASAMPNLGPGFIFIIASCLRLENFDVKSRYTRAKMLGTLVCLGGAMAMSFLRGSSPSSLQLTSLSPGHLHEPGHGEWMLGCFYLLAGVLILSCNTVLQAATLISFPAPLSICVMTSMMGSLFTVMLQLITEGKLGVGSTSINAALLVEIVIVGGVTIGSCVAFQTWCVGKKGPVFVSIFSPFQTVCSVFISAVVLKQTISIGRLAGIVLMFSGLYIVLWAKNSESFHLLEAGDVSMQSDIEKPILS